MILVTGGTGYIGSHACVALAQAGHAQAGHAQVGHVQAGHVQAGHDIVILDNLSNSRFFSPSPRLRPKEVPVGRGEGRGEGQSIIDRLEKLCGKRPEFIHGDIRDNALLDRIFADHPIRAVIHFAGLKAVGESVAKPVEYYDNARTAQYR